MEWKVRRGEAPIVVRPRRPAPCIDRAPFATRPSGYNAPMSPVRRVFSAFILLCVVLALGDAPYVDEFLEDLALARAPSQELPAVDGHRHSNEPISSKSTSGASRICQNLLNLSGTQHPVEIATTKTASGVTDTARTSFSSASLPRIDRPPATLA